MGDDAEHEAWRRNLVASRLTRSTIQSKDVGSGADKEGAREDCQIRRGW